MYLKAVSLKTLSETPGFKNEFKSKVGGSPPALDTN
jgi:hypothetical protein